LVNFDVCAFFILFKKATKNQNSKHLQKYLFKELKIKDVIIWNGLKAVTFIGKGDTHKKRAILVPKYLIRNESSINKL
jgi:LytS/YehU family sensor histidine kinase